jgi:mitosis inhibitor protein kinase SWE1
MFRQESAATLFFGPAIPSPNNVAPVVRSRTSTALSSLAPSSHFGGMRPKVTNRHSYAGPGSDTGNIHPWNTIQIRSQSPSPGTSPHVLDGDRSGFDDDDENIFFGEGPQDSSFLFSVTEGTPSPRSRKTSTASLPVKYKPRDSGVVVSDDEDHLMSINDHLAVPTASSSVNSLQSDEDDNLVTPGFVPDASSGWPRVFVTGTDDVSGKDLQSGSREGVDVDAFIMRTLAAASKGPVDGKKKVPGTPVKRAKTTYLVERPWQSAVAPKIDREDWDTKKGKVPRKSLPAAFPGLGQKAGKLTFDHRTDSEEEEESPSSRRDKYVGLGLGRPSASTPQDGLPIMSRTRWLMRRSSSGAFSSGSESQSSAGTPTRVKGKGSFPKQNSSFYCAHLWFDTFNRLALGSRSRSIFAIKQCAQVIARAFCRIVK